MTRRTAERLVILALRTMLIVGVVGIVGGCIAPDTKVEQEHRETTSKPVHQQGVGVIATDSRQEGAQQTGAINLSLAIMGGGGFLLFVRELFHKWMDDRSDSRIAASNERIIQSMIGTLWLCLVAGCV